MFTRPLPASAVVGAVYVGATPQVLFPSNAARANFLAQGVDSFFVGVVPTMTASAGLLVASGAFFPPDTAPISHTGPVYAVSNAGAQATIAIRTWENSN